MIVALVAKAIVLGIRAWVGAIVTAIIAPVFARLAIAGLLIPGLLIALLVTRLLIAWLLVAWLLVAWLLIALLVARLITLLLIALLLLALPRLLLGGKFALRFGQQAGVMLGVLVEVLGRNPVVRQLRVAGQENILFNDLLWGAAHLAVGARAIEDAVDDIANGARAVRFGTRTGFGGSHLVLVSRMIWLGSNACGFGA